MTREEIQEWTLREPFTPFVIVTRGGKRYRIPDYGYVLVRLRSLAIKTQPIGFDLPFVDIVACEPMRKKPAARRRRKRA